MRMSALVLSDVNIVNEHAGGVMIPFTVEVDLQMNGCLLRRGVFGTRGLVMDTYQNMLAFRSQYEIKTYLSQGKSQGDREGYRIDYQSGGEPLSQAIPSP